MLAKTGKKEMNRVVVPPLSHWRSPARRFVRVPALALVALLVAAGVPCLACDGPQHAAGSPEIASPASCHGAGEATAPSCAPRIRAADTALPSLVMPSGSFAILAPAGPSLHVVAAPETAAPPLPRLAPIPTRHLYLLHESLLA